MPALMYTTADLHAIAEKILALQPDPAPRFRLLRDVLHLDPASPNYQQAKTALQTASIVELLERSQLPDGTWGRFHTQDTRVKQPFPTTESALQSALAAGLDRDSPILVKAQAAVLDYVNANTCWPDPPEKHDNPLAWYVWVRQYSAAVLSEIDPDHPSLEAYWQLWAEAADGFCLRQLRPGPGDRRPQPLAGLPHEEPGAFPHPLPLADPLRHPEPDAR